jgi:hypothetical protein
MASKYGSAYTDKFQTVPSVAIAGNKYGGRVRACYDSYTLTADLSAADKIYMGKLPKGARVLDVIVAFADLDASGGTIDVGYEYNATGESSLTDDPDAFLADVDVTSAGTVGMIEQANMVGFGYEIEGDADIIVTIDGDTDATSGTIKLLVYYAAP